MTLFDDITFKYPVLRINNRSQNIEFYQKLGFNLLNEENAMVEFSAKDKKVHFAIEESPSPQTRSVKGIKKVNRLVVKIPKANEILTILGNGITIERLLKGEKGYAFETLSPEGDLFLCHSEDDINRLKEIPKRNFPKNDEIKAISDFYFESITLNVIDKMASQRFYSDVFEEKFPVDMQFIQADGFDLSVNPLETWDLEILECQVPKHYNLRILADAFKKKGKTIYLDKKASILVLSDPNNIEIWFTK